MSALANDGFAILSLCRLGFDVQARALMRVFIEKADLFVAVYADPDLASRYISDSTFEGSREIFFKSLSKGKLKKAAQSGFKALVPEPMEYVDWLWTEWRNELDLMLGTYIHA